MTILVLMIGLVLGLIIMTFLVKIMMPKMMFAAYKSKLDFMKQFLLWKNRQKRMVGPFPKVAIFNKIISKKDLRI